MKKYETPVAEVINFDSDYVLASVFWDEGLIVSDPIARHGGGSGSGGGSD